MYVGMYLYVCVFTYSNTLYILAQLMSRTTFLVNIIIIHILQMGNGIPGRSYHLSKVAHLMSGGAGIQT